MNKKNITIWSLYDFANNIVYVGFFLYFSQWLVLDNKVADIWFNLLFVASSFLLLLTAPIFASIADKMNTGLKFLRFLTILEFVSALLMSLGAILLPLSRTNLILIGILFILQNYFFNFTYIFYNPMLAVVAPPKSQGKISGIGNALSFVGSLVGGAIALSFAIGAVYLFGHPGRAQSFLPVTITFFLFSLPMLFFFKESNPAKKVVIDIAKEYKNFYSSFKSLMKIPGVGLFLLGFFFFIDAILTAQDNFPIFLAQVFEISDTTKSIVLALALIGSVFGSIIVGWVSDIIGLKKTLISVIFAFIIVFLVMAIAQNFIVFSSALFVTGFLLGALWAVSRAMFMALTPPEKLRSAFSYYGIFENFSTLIGPVIWGLITYLLIDLGNLRYRIALGSMAILIFIGLLIITKIPNKKTS